MISGKWKMEFKGNDFPLISKQIDFLNSWTDDPFAKNFSGTGCYAINFNLPSDYTKKGIKLFLDLGKVGNVPEAVINDKNTGIIWMRRQKLEVTDAVKAGNNKLVIFVTNTLINRVSAMKEPPPVPEELVLRFGSGAVSKEVPREFGFKSLPASGLIGLVRIVPMKVVTVNY